MFKRYFKEFDFRGFIDFILEIVDYYGLGEIRFNPEHKENFSEVQLTHIAPGRSINNPNGFVWAWKRAQNSVRRVSFDQFSKDEKRKITMTIDLDEKYISLDRVEGISSIEVEDTLKKNMTIEAIEAIVLPIGPQGPSMMISENGVNITVISNKDKEKNNNKLDTKQNVGKKWFSMDNPIIWLIFTLLATLLVTFIIHLISSISK